MPEWKRRGGVMPDFPKGCGCDQQIFRFLYPRFAETLRLDYSGRLGTLPKRKALGSIVRRSRRALRKAYGVSTSANMRNV